MPSSGTIPLSKVRALCEQLERLLKPPVLNDSERAVLHAHDVDPEERTKDDWWKRYAEVASYARRKEKWVPDVGSVTVDESALMDVLASQPVEVTCTDGELRRVTPASWDRILVVEDLWYWMTELEIIRSVLRSERGLFTNREELLQRTHAELRYVRGWLYAQVCAPSFRPLEMGDDPPDWTRELTQEDHLRLVDAWLVVHVTRPREAERVIRLKYPAPKQDSDDSVSGSLAGFPFMLASIAYRENRSPEYVKRDRALTEVMATYSIAGQSQAHAREQAEQKAEAEKRKAAAQRGVSAASRGRR